VSNVFLTLDRLVSIEMIEAVGHENLPEYFGIIDRMLKPSGRAVLQAISNK
jgi:cyclopropane-fatty-acyl-phospholipid synthase